MNNLEILINNKKFEIGETKHGFYISPKGEDYLYLRQNGSIEEGTGYRYNSCDDNMGYFKSFEEINKAIDLYKKQNKD